MSDPLAALTAALADRYRIERELGAGGMATVYLAHDVRHDRQVAIKVLRPELAAVIGAERFLTEIRTTANLQHPHILPLYDSGRAGGWADGQTGSSAAHPSGATANGQPPTAALLFYVMPFVEGESLRDRLAREKQLPVADAVAIAAEVAGALDYAHRRGVIHRDIKPENILLHDGRALVADFGIALAVTTAGGSRLTETGLSLGTPHYMSPEQAMGERDLDARSDVYALGATLYEMLIGEPPFQGPTAQAIVAKVMTAEPESVTTYRKTVPPHVDAAVQSALQKLPADRFRTAAAFGEALTGPAPAAAGRRDHRAAGQVDRRITILASIAVAATVVAAWGWLRSPPAAPTPPPTRLAVLAPNLGGASTGLQRQIALTPDGSTLLYAAVTADGSNRTMRLTLDASEPVPLPGVVPYMADYVISPDGREFIGAVLDRREVYRYSLAGGTARPLPPGIGVPHWAAWARDGSVWISDSDFENGLARVDGAGNLTRPFGPRTRDLIVTQVLPDDRTALAIREPQGTANGPAILLDLRSGEPRPLFDIPVVAVFYTQGYLVYCLPGGSVEAVPFDAAAKRVAGSAVEIAQGVSMTGAAKCQLVVADNGTVAYVPEEPRSLVLVDRSGSARALTAEGHNFHDPAFSPDGRHVAVDFNTADGRDVWVLELATGALTRATFDRDGHDPSWMPGGRSLLYSSLRGGPFGIYRTSLGSTEPPDSVVVTPALSYTGIWDPTSDAIVTVTSPTSEVGANIVRVSNGGRGPIEPLVATRFEESYPALSPDGRWLAYVSNATGRTEVYVRAARGGGGDVRVSLDGGGEPVFGPDGRELFYRTASQLFVARLTYEPQLAVAARRVAFDVSDIATGYPHSNYDVSPDGRTFAMIRLNPSSRIMVIQNLPALVRNLTGNGTSP